MLSVVRLFALVFHDLPTLSVCLHLAVDIFSGNKTAFTYCIGHFRVPNANEPRFPQGNLSVRREPMKIDFFQTVFLCRVNADTPVRQQLVPFN